MKTREEGTSPLRPASLQRGRRQGKGDPFALKSSPADQQGVSLRHLALGGGKVLVKEPAGPVASQNLAHAAAWQPRPAGPAWPAMATLEAFARSLTSTGPCVQAKLRVL